MTDKAKNGTASTTTILAAAEPPLSSLRRAQTTGNPNKSTNQVLTVLRRAATVVSSSTVSRHGSLESQLSNQSMGTIGTISLVESPEGREVDPFVFLTLSSSR